MDLRRERTQPLRDRLTVGEDDVAAPEDRLVVAFDPVALPRTLRVPRAVVVHHVGHDHVGVERVDDEGGIQVGRMEPEERRPITDAVPAQH